MSFTAAVKLLFRVALVTIAFAMLGFALGGLLGILSVIVMSAARVPVNMMNSLWFGAVPGGVLGCIAGLIIITISEKRSRGAAPRSTMHGC
ncbi:MAG: hypothetical protein ACXVZR_04925 [Terriglobales bacterium]